MSLDNLDGQITPNDLIDLGIATRDSNGRLSSGGSISASEQPNTKVYIDLMTGDVVIETNSVERARIAEDGTITGLAAAADVPTLSELVSSVFYVSGITSGTFNLGMFVAPFACKFAAVSLVTAENHAQSDTDYWTFTAEKQPGNLVIATKTTQLTGGYPITQWTDWNFDAVAFDPTNQLLAKGDFVRMKIAATGAPASITGLTVTLRYEPT